MKGGLVTNTISDDLYGFCYRSATLELVKPTNSKGLVYYNDDNIPVNSKDQMA